MTEIDVVVGAQYGSEGKGAVCAHLIRSTETNVAVRVGGSQAGHTAIDDMGRAWPLRHVPVAAVADPDTRLYIAPGSEIDPDVLEREIDELEAAGHSVIGRLWVSPEATVITEQHKQAEADMDLTGRLGSTAKGVGVARAERLLRRAKRWGDLTPLYLQTADPNWIYRHDSRIQIEGVQGYALGLHAGLYPFCTSADATAVDFIAMAGIAAPWHHRVNVWMAIRPNPIRVAGNSGPMKDETTWEELGLAPEYTTVTKKVRRVGGWDRDLVADAAAANGGNAGIPVNGALTMADHTWPELAGRVGRISISNLPDSLRRRISELAFDGVRVRLLGTGPGTMLEIGR